MDSDRPLVDAADLHPISTTEKIKRMGWYAVIVLAVSLLTVAFIRGSIGPFAPFVVLLLVIGGLVFGVVRAYRARERKEWYAAVVGYHEARSKILAHALESWRDRPYEELRELCGQEFSEVVRSGGATLALVVRCLYDTGEFVHIVAILGEIGTPFYDWRDLLVFRDGRVECDPRIASEAAFEDKDLPLYEPFRDTVTRNFRYLFESHHLEILGVYQAPNGVVGQLMATARNLVFLFVRVPEGEWVAISKVGERPEWHDVRTVLSVSPYEIEAARTGTLADVAGLLFRHGEEVFRLHDALNIKNTEATLAVEEEKAAAEFAEMAELDGAEVEVTFTEPVYLWETECPGGLSGTIIRLVVFDGCDYWLVAADYVMKGRNFQSDCFLLWAADGSAQPGQLFGGEPLKLAVALVAQETVWGDAVDILQQADALGEAVVQAKGKSLFQRLIARASGKSRRVSQADRERLRPFLAVGVVAVFAGLFLLKLLAGVTIIPTGVIIILAIIVAIISRSRKQS